MSSPASSMPSGARSTSRSACRSRCSPSCSPELLRKFPAEVQPLVDDLNNLIEVNAGVVRRARTQAGNLAHALKTPLAVLTDEAQRLEARGEGQAAAVILQQSQRMQR